MLNKPVTDKMTSTVTTPQFHMAVCGMQGWRKNMEDAHTLSYQLNGDRNRCLFGVFDGHGGQEVAEIVAEKIQAAVTSNESFKREKYPEALLHGVCAVEDALSKQGRAYAETGATSNLVLLAPGKIICANTGDTRAVLCRKGHAVELSKDHRPGDKDEYERVERNGGLIEDGRIGGMLAVCRAIGDFQLKPELPRKGILATLFFNAYKESFAVDNQIRRQSLAANLLNNNDAGANSASQSIIALGFTVPEGLTPEEKQKLIEEQQKQMENSDELDREYVFDPGMVPKLVFGDPNEADDDDEDEDNNKNSNNDDDDDLFGKGVSVRGELPPEVMETDKNDNEKSINNNKNENTATAGGPKPKPSKINANDVIFTQDAFKGLLHQSQLTAIPDITEMKWEKEVDEFIIIACDGVWDMFTSQEVVNMIRPRLMPLLNRRNENDNSSSSKPQAFDLGPVLEEVLDRCLAPAPLGNGTDNFTLMVVVPSKKWTTLA